MMHFKETYSGKNSSPKGLLPLEGGKITEQQ